MDCITGGIAEVFYGGIPKEIADNAIKRLNDDFLKVIYDFYTRFVE